MGGLYKGGHKRRKITEVGYRLTKAARASVAKLNAEGGIAAARSSWWSNTE